MGSTRQRGSPSCPPRESESRRETVPAPVPRAPAGDSLRSARDRRCVDGGFTLIELVIAVVIVGVLAAIALPAYTQQILRANRAQAKQFIEDIANREEQYLLDQRSYTATIGGGG